MHLIELNHFYVDIEYNFRFEYIEIMKIDTKKNNFKLN